MIDTSKDLLYIVLIFCILWFTIFLTWWLFHLAQLTKNLNILIGDLRRRLEIIFNAIDFIRDKMGLLASAVGFLAEHFLSKKSKTKKTKK